LPKALQDAVVVTRGLGIRYLWIDVLCIIQDSPDDWQVESSNMAAIYSNAYIVISADFSADCHARFLPRKSRNGSPGERALVKVTEPNDSTFIVYRRPQHGHPHPLDSSMFTLQEEVLASRIVHFAESELYWRFQCSVSCECTELDGTEEPDDINPRLHFKRCLEWDDPNQTRREWQLLVNDYMRRNITKSTDRSSALSGMAKALSDAGNLGRFNAGLWTAHLPFALLWKSGASITRCVTPYRAPSWSWLSLEMPYEPYLTGS
ncbi:hypothetical protein CC86DRAFT_291575, partial [Ophiobolus disseminans]